MLTVDFNKLAVREGDIVLDAGCGFGRHSLEFLQRGATVFSLDMDMESVRKTRFVLAELKRSKKMKTIPSYFVNTGDALNLPYHNESFDKIICAEVMEHVDDDSRACSEMVRVLKKNGHIAITVPTFFSEFLYDALTFEYFSTPGGHVRKYLPKKLVKIMRDNGLEIYGIGFKHSFHTIWWLIRCVVGLHLDQHPATRAYHTFLHLGLLSKFMRKCERFFDNFFPKSIIIYAWKK
jgi:SAM-dependent methyltransferase